MGKQKQKKRKSLKTNKQPLNYNTAKIWHLPKVTRTAFTALFT